MDTLTHDDIRDAVRARYGTIAETRSASASPTDASCCGSPSPEAAEAPRVAAGLPRRHST